MGCKSYVQLGGHALEGKRHALPWPFSLAGIWTHGESSWSGWMRKPQDDSNEREEAWLLTTSPPGPLSCPDLQFLTYFLTNTVVSPGSIVMVSMLVSVTRPWTPYEDLSPYSQFRTVAPELLWGPCECLWNECMNEWRFCDIYQLVMEVVTDASEMWRKRHLPFEMYV